MSYRSSHSRSSKEARIALVGIFVAFRLLDVGTYFSMPPAFQHDMLVRLALSAMWTTVFLGAIWYGQSWARYVLCGLLLLSIVFVVGTLPEMFRLGLPIPWIIPVSALVYLVVILLIAFLPSIRDHVRRR